jgi:hypothetical protein
MSFVKKTFIAASLLAAAPVVIAAGSPLAESSYYTVSPQAMDFGEATQWCADRHL